METWRVLRVPVVLRLWLSQLGSTLGDWSFAIAAMIWIGNVTDDPRWVSALFIAQAVPVFVFGPVLGVWPDRASPRKLMVGADLVRAVGLGVLVFGAHPLQPWMLVAAMAGLATASQVFTPARSVAFGRLVEKSQWEAASGLFQATGFATRLAGYSLGAVLLIAFGIRWAAGLDALSFLLSGAILAGLPGVPRQEQIASQPGWVEQMRTGWATLWRNAILRTILWAISSVSIGAAALTALDYFFVTGALHGTPEMVGPFNSVATVGSLIGALVAPPLLGKFADRRVFTLSLLWLGGMTIVYSRMNAWLWALPLMAILSIPEGLINTTLAPMALKQLPAGYIGQVFGTLNAAGQVMTVAGTAIAGAVARQWSVPDIFFGVGLFIMLVGVFVAWQLAPWRGEPQPAEQPSVGPITTAPDEVPVEPAAG
jgi:MFS family permease